MLLPPAPRGLLIAGMHGEEPETVLLARRLVERVSAHEAAVAVVLCANPDGTAQGTRQNAAGVDINRNFPAASWRAGTSYSFPPGIDPGLRELANRTNASSTGSAPLSEPESAGLVALAERLQPAWVVDLHAPLDLVLTSPGAPAGIVDGLASAAGLSVEGELAAPTPGSMRDWLIERGVASIVYEVEHAGLPDLCRRHLPGLEQLVRGELA